MSGRVIALHVRSERSAAPAPMDQAVGRVDGGIEGDFHVAKKARSVLVVDRSTLDAFGLAPGALREQVTVEGLDGVTLVPEGTLLRVGGLTLRVNGECEPCTHIGELLGMEDPESFRVSLVGRRGAVCTVVAADGPARVGDPVEVVTAAVA